MHDCTVTSQWQLIMRDIWKVTSSELLSKQVMRIQIVLCTKNSYIHTLLLNIGTAKIEALAMWGNKFLYSCVKEACYLWSEPHFDTFHRLIIVEALLSKPVLQVGKQVVVVQSEIRAVRRVVRPQLKCSSSAQVQTVVYRRALSWRSPTSTLDVSIPHLLFWMALHSFF
jgi:hypothetical protein